MAEIEHLLTLAKAYGAAAAIEPVTVSWRVFGDSKKLVALEAGAGLTLSRYSKALRWFSDNWPADAVWPDQIGRPSAEAA